MDSKRFPILKTVPKPSELSAVLERARKELDAYRDAVANGAPHERRDG